MRYKVDGKYPMMANWLMVKRPHNGIYQIKNALTDEWYAMNETVYGFLRELDGNTDPKYLGEKWDVDYKQMIDELEENQLIRTEKISQEVRGRGLPSHVPWSGNPMF